LALVDFRKKHCISDPLFAHEIGGQTHHGLTEKLPKIEDFSQKVMGYIFLLPRRCPAQKNHSKDFTP